MLLGVLLVLLLDLGFLFSVLPQSMRASPANMPTPACAALASQVENILTILSEKSSTVPMSGMRVRARSMELFSALGSDAPRAPSFFTTQEIASQSLVSSGSVGIGTTAPASSLQVVSGQILAPNGSSSAPAYSFGNNANTGLYTDGYTLGFAVAGNQVGYMDTSGNLDWYGQINGATFLSGSGSSSGSAAYPTFTFSSANYNAGMYSSGANTINFSTNSLERMRITASGHVGMVFTSPLFTLPIAAIIHALKAAFLNLSRAAKRNRNQARGRGTSRAAPAFGYQFCPCLCLKPV